MEQGQLWRQYVVAGVANVTVAFAGFTIGWMSPVSPKLRDPATSPLDFIPTIDQIAWMGSVFTIGSLCGPFIGGPAAAKLGRKWGLICTCVPLILGWILVLVAVDMFYLYAARILWGIYSAMVFSITPVYCAEIATDDVRGALCTLIQVFMALGYLLAFAIGPYLSYWDVAYVGIASVISFAVIFSFMPETPTYYLLKNNREAAASSLCALRGRSLSGVEDEICSIEMNIRNSATKSAAVMEVFRGNNFKALYITCAVMLFQEFSGINALLFYLTDIFKDSGFDLDPGIATIIIGAVQVVASVFTPFFVDRLGRRPLLLVSCCGSAIALILLGLCFLMVANGSEVVTKIRFLPVLCVVLYMLTYYFGLGPLPWTLLGELFTVEVKAVASPIVTVACSLMAFLVTRFFEPIAVALSKYAVFWLFAFFCIIGFFFTMFFVPETKGKSFQEIQDMLAGRQIAKVEKTSTSKPTVTVN